MDCRLWLELAFSTIFRHFESHPKPPAHMATAWGVGFWELGCCGSWGCTSYLRICRTQKAWWPHPAPSAAVKGRDHGARLGRFESAPPFTCAFSGSRWPVCLHVGERRTPGARRRVPVLLPIWGPTVAAHWGALSVPSRGWQRGPVRWDEWHGDGNSHGADCSVRIKSDDFHINHFKQCPAQTPCYRILANIVTVLKW